MKRSHDLPGFHGFSNYTGLPVTAVYCFAAQNFKKKWCKNGVSCKGEIWAVLGHIWGRLMKCSGGTDFCPWWAAYLTEEGAQFLTAVNLDVSFWTTVLPQWPSSPIFFSIFFLLCVLCSLKFCSLCCLFLLSGKPLITLLGSPPHAQISVCCCF